MEKADTTKKFAAIVQRLVNKFPKMVRLVKDPKQEYQEQMAKLYGEAKASAGYEEPPVKKFDHRSVPPGPSGRPRGFQGRPGL